MKNKRYKELNGLVDHKLTDSEIKEGWHFCNEFDGLCRNSNEEDFKCDCNEFQSSMEHCPVCHKNVGFNKLILIQGNLMCKKCKDDNLKNNTVNPICEACKCEIDHNGCGCDPFDA